MSRFDRKYPRSARDLYRTIEPRAVRPLIPHLPPTATYYEPCAGYGDLINNMEAESTVDCIGAADIEPCGPMMLKRDARFLTESKLNASCDFIITNPPYARDLLHELIEVFVNVRPTWLLIDADWMHTAQAARLIDLYCVKIVAVGRLRFFPQSKYESRESYCWYLFIADKIGTAQPLFYPRQHA